MTETPAVPRRSRTGRYARYGAYFLAADVILSAIAAFVLAH